MRADMLFRALLPIVTAAFAAAPPVLPSLSRAQSIDFRIEVGRDPYLLRISQDDLRRLTEALALGEGVPSMPSAIVVRESLFPPSADRRVPPELARRAAALWRLVEERGWSVTAGVEWDPELGHPARLINDRGDIMRDAPGPIPGSRAGVWVAPEKGAARDSKRYGVRCVESLAGPKRCFRIWPAGPSPRRP